LYVTTVHELSTPSEIEAFRALLRQYAAEYPGRFSERMTQDLADLPGRYAAPTGGLYLAYADDTAVATAAWTRVNDEQAEIKRVYVQPQARGRGSGQALSRHVADVLRERGFRQMVLSTWGDNAGAIALYRKLGFVDIVPFKAITYPGMAFMGLDL
jgi:putative acetyltransferase